MREYRRRKRAAKMSAPVSRGFSPSIVSAPEPSRVPEPIIKRRVPQPAHPKTGFVQPGPRSSFKTALELARSFPSGSTAHGCAGIAITRATARPVHGAAIVREKDEVPYAADIRGGPPPSTLWLSLTCLFTRRNIPASGYFVRTRGTNGFALPHSPQDWWRRYGRGLRGGGPQARSPRRPEVPPRRTRQRRTGPQPFSAGSQSCILSEPPEHLHDLRN